MSFPPSPYEKTGGIVYFPRMAEKIRQFAAGTLHPDLHENLGKGFDRRCCNFLRVSYEALAGEIRNGASDGSALEWAFAQGRQPSEEEIEIWNEFMRKRGWNDIASEIVIKRKAQSGLADRDDVVTMFDYIDADEGRSLHAGHHS